MSFPSPRNSRALAGLCLLSGLLALSCGNGSPSSPNLPPAGSSFSVFTDPASGFSTTDVRDLDDQIVRFNTADNTMLWTPDNLLFDGWVVNGNFLDAARMFQVRFGSVSGEKRAYFTEAGRGTLCDLKVEQNILQLLPTNVFPPQS